MERQVGGGIPDGMLVVFRIMAAVEGERPPSEIAVQVPDLIGSLFLRHDRRRVLDAALLKAGGLAHEGLDHADVVLRQHGGDRIEFRREFEEGEVIRFGVLHRQHVARRLIDVGVLVPERISFDLEVRERERLREVEPLLRVRIRRVAVIHDVADVRVLRRQGDVVGIGGGTHGEEESPCADEFLDLPGDRLFQFRHFLETELLRLPFQQSLLFLVPCRAGEGGIELPVLSGEVFVMQVEPVVLRERAVHHLFVPYLVELDLRVLQGERDRVVPRLESGGDIDGDAGRLLEAHHVHVVVFTLDVGVDSGRRRRRYLLEGNPPDAALRRDHVESIEHEGPSAVVQEPVDLQSFRERPVADAVGLQVVGLREVHRNQDLPLRPGGGDDREKEEEGERVSSHVTGGLPGAGVSMCGPGRRGCLKDIPPGAFRMPRSPVPGRGARCGRPPRSRTVPCPGRG